MPRLILAQSGFPCGEKKNSETDFSSSILLLNRLCTVSRKKKLFDLILRLKHEFFKIRHLVNKTLFI